jgi:threonine dehydrogenase-like Zn-dependent dehydrogenase
VTTSARELVFTAPYSVSLEEVDVPEPGERELLVDVRYSGISAGTELGMLKGTSPRLHVPTLAPLRYPVRAPGYMEVGVVRHAPGRDSLRGTTVALRCGHRTAAVVAHGDPDSTALPASLEPLQGIWVQRMLPICGNGLLHASVELAAGGQVDLGSGVRGCNVAVFGAGVVGLILAAWAADLGAREVVVVDRTPRRLEAAKALGLVPCHDRGAAADEVRAAWGHGPGDAGADVVFQCRAATSALVAALESVRPGRPVVDLAFYQTDAAGLHLGTAFHHAGLVLRAAQIGNLPRAAVPSWSLRRLVDEGIGLLERIGGRLADVLITDVVPLGESPAFLERMARDRSGSTLQAVIEMPGPSG